MCQVLKLAYYSSGVPFPLNIGGSLDFRFFCQVTTVIIGVNYFRTAIVFTQELIVSIQEAIRVLGVYVIYKLQSRFNIAKELISIVNKGTVNFVSLKGLRVQQGAVDYLYNIRVYLYKEVYKNFAGVLGFSYFSIINIAYLGSLQRQEKN